MARRQGGAVVKRSPLRRKSRLRPASKKRAKQLRDYTRLRKVFLKDFPRCGVCGTAPATDIHHIAGRNHAMLNEPAWWIAVCRGCHDHIHRHPGEARAKGLLK